MIAQANIAKVSMTTFGSDSSGIMAALEQFEAVEANLIKLERLWAELLQLIPIGISYGENIEYEERARSYKLLLDHLPYIKGWKATAVPPDLDGVAQNPRLEQSSRPNCGCRCKNT